MPITSRITNTGKLLITGTLEEGKANINFDKNGNLFVDNFEEDDMFSFGNITPTKWSASKTATLNKVCMPTVNNSHTYICTTAGTTGASEPTWPTGSGNTVTDGTVIWTENGLIKNGGGNDIEVVDFEEGVTLV